MPSVNKKGSDLEAWDTIYDVLLPFAARHNLNIVVSNPHGSKTELSEREELFYIKFWSTPSSVSSSKSMIGPPIFGHELGGGTRDCFELSADEPNAFYSDTAVPVALFYPNAIYVLFDLPHSRDPELVRHILQMILDGYESRTFGKPDMEPSISADREGYAEACMRSVIKHQEKIRKDIKGLQSHIDTLTTQLTDQYRKMELLELESFKASQVDERKAYFEHEYDKLLEMPEIKQVKITTSGTIQVYTSTIYLTYNREEYEIGDFLITYPARGGVRIINTRVRELTGQEFVQHPHVFYEDGSHTCFGNIGPGIAKLIAEHEYAIATHVIIRFLNSLTKESQYIDHLKRNFQPLKKPRKVVGGKSA